MKCSSNSWLRLRVPSSEEEALAFSEDYGAADFGFQRPRRRLELGFLGLKRIFTRVMVATMGCFLSCFRVKDSSPSPNSDAASSNPGVPVGAVARKRSPLSSLLLSEENDGLLTKLKEDQDLGTPKPELDFNLKELKDEAQFLKACGTIAETPAEIRKFSQKWKDSSALEGHHERSELKSWLTNTSIDKLNLETASDLPLTPSKDCEQTMKVLASLEQTPSSCMTDGQNAEGVFSSPTELNDTKNAGSIELVASPRDSISGSSVTTGDIVQSVKCKNKFVRFDCDSDISSASSKNYLSERFGQISKQSGSSNSSDSKSSPYPTPLKLSDEMQTPGTVFPAYLDATGEGNNTRIRCQYVYSALNPMENFSQLKELKSGDSSSDHQNNHIGESFEQTDEQSPTAEVHTGETSAGKEFKVEATLSSWLRRAPVLEEDGHVEHNDSTNHQNFRFGRTPADRPILGMVAAHWNDEHSQVSPKWWDGNGIPNSTNKYKEDQKVNWHATPFEERLEKALSEETSISERNQINTTPPPDFTETEESDTAVSQLHPSNHFKSVVSF